MNLFDLPPLPLTEELTTILAESADARVERIVSTGQTTDWYDQEETEFVALLSGNAVIEYDGKPPVSLKAGDTLLIHEHERHRVSYTSCEPPCIWICVFMRKRY
jgi:cupin 2 domain-containing protein